MLAFPVILWLLSAESTPQSHVEAANSAGMHGRHWTRAEVLRSRFFWMLLPMLLGPPAWGTELFFQQVHIAEVKDWPLIDYVALIPLLTAVSVVVTVLCGQVIDRIGSARLAIVYLIPYAAAFLVIGLAQTLAMAAVGMVLFGIGTGIQARCPPPSGPNFLARAISGQSKPYLPASWFLDRPLALGFPVP